MTFCPFATKRPGPPSKTNALSRTGKGVVMHSAEGSLAGSFAILDSLTGPTLASWQKSWHFTIDSGGMIYQHYPLEASTWHAGAKANGLYVGIEHEGVAGTPITDAQVRADVALIKWIGSVESWPGYFRSINLFEHNAFMETACPSGRIRWVDILAGIQGEDPKDILLSIAAARFNAIEALARGEWIARHNEDRSCVKIQDAKGNDRSEWLPLEGWGA